METITDIKKMDAKTLAKKVADAQKEIYDNKQKMFRGEVKDNSIFKKLKKNVARMLTVLNQTKENNK